MKRRNQPRRLYRLLMAIVSCLKADRLRQKSHPAYPRGGSGKADHGSSVFRLRDSNAFDAIERLNPMQLSQFIQNEHPQTIALILAHLAPNSSAELLESLPEDIQADVAVRMASLETISPDVIRGISAVLEEKLRPMGTYAHNQAYGGIRAVAELLNRMDRRKSRAVLEKIDGNKPEVATSIRELMFVFEDIVVLDDLAIREILQRIDKRTIATALKGATDQQQQQFFRNMSSRGVEMMKRRWKSWARSRSKTFTPPNNGSSKLSGNSKKKASSVQAAAMVVKNMSSRIIRGGLSPPTTESKHSIRRERSGRLAGSRHGCRETGLRARLRGR